MFRTALLLMFLAVAAQAATEERNPFQSYHDQIAKAEKKMAEVDEKQKKRYEDLIVQIKERLKKAVETKRAPYDKKLERYNKDLKKTKSESSKKRLQKRIDDANEMVKKIEDWAKGTTPEEPKKEEKVNKKK